MHFNTVVAERPKGIFRVIIIVVKTCHCSVSTCGPFASCLPLFKKRVRQLFDNQQNCFVCLKWAFLFYREWILKHIKGTWLWWCVCTCEKISRGSPSYIKSDKFSPFMVNLLTGLFGVYNCPLNSPEGKTVITLHDIFTIFINNLCSGPAGFQRFQYWKFWLAF